MAARTLKRKLAADHTSPSAIDSHESFPRKKTHCSTSEGSLDSAPSASPSIADTQMTAGVAATRTPNTEASSIRSGKPRPKKYLCTFPACNKAYSRPIHLQNHVNSHTGERPHACSFTGCEKTFTKSEHLSRHVREKHATNESKTCLYTVHDEITGSAAPCGKTFPTPETYRRHVARHEEKEETRCTWIDCGKVFRKQDTLQRHIRKDHLNELPYVCTRDMPNGGQCGEAFGTPGMLKRHTEREHDAPRYFCNLCNHPKGIFVQAQSQPANMLGAQSLPTPDDMQIDGDDVDSTILRSLTLEETAPEGMHYPSGAVGFTTYGDLQHHLKVVHPPTCDQCGKQCKSRKDLAAHMDIHHCTSNAATRIPATQIACTYSDCPRALPGNGFNSKSNFNTHVKTVHKQERRFVCGTFDLTGNVQLEGWDGQGCGLSLASKATLIGHIRTQHLGLAQEPRKCRREKKGPQTKKGSMLLDDALEKASATLSMITGYGYDERRPVACLLASSGCQLRFIREYDMCVHMELTHGWNVDDINDAVDGIHMAEEVGMDETAAEITLRQQLADQMAVSRVADRIDMPIDPRLGGIVV